MQDIADEINTEVYNDNGPTRVFLSPLWENPKLVDISSPKSWTPIIIPTVTLNYPPTEAVLDKLTEDAYNYIVANHVSDNDGKLIIGGFSYGGMLAMHLVRRLEGHEDIRIDHLITLDPAAGPSSGRLDRTVPDNVEKNTNVYQTSSDNTVGSFGAPNSRRDGSVDGIENIEVTDNHEDINDTERDRLKETILKELKREE